MPSLLVFSLLKMMMSQNRKPLTIKVPQYENETKRMRNIILETTANSFAKHFSDKIKLNVGKTRVDVNGVYNGKCKLIAVCIMIYFI